MKTIYVAGGCFWGVEKFFKDHKNVISTKVGYAQSNKENITYEEACSGIYNATEAVEINYNGELTIILELLFRIIDPTSLNKQGNDKGVQYRTGIYSNDMNDLEIANEYINSIQNNYDNPIVVEVELLKNFYVGEEYHQNYLEKNVGGYCHINLNLLKDSERK